MSKYKDFEEGYDNRIWFFDISKKVPEFKQFDLPSMIAGDTDSTYNELPVGLTEGKTQDEIIAEADKVGKKIDATFPEFVQKVFNCPEDRKDTIRTDREVVSDKSFFLTKKRYVMHVVDDEGKKVDKLKITGVEIKKSDTSQAIKTMLMELVEAFLDGWTITEVQTLIQQMKAEFRDRFSVFEIAKPISCKTLRKYEKMYEMTGSMKSIPYHVKAAMLYNKRCTNKDKRIVSGDKIRLVYIRGGDEKYIAFPVDLEEYPEWWLSDFSIDYNTEWEKAHTKITNYLKAMGWDINSRKQQKAKELFGF